MSGIYYSNFIKTTIASKLISVTSKVLINMLAMVKVSMWNTNLFLVGKNR